MESNSSTMKKTRGRRKIEMKKIENRKNLQVTFTKRRKGLFGKSGELAALCGSEIAILVQSPGEKICTFGYPSAEYALRKYESAGTTTHDNYSTPGDSTHAKNVYFGAVARLEERKRTAKEIAVGDSGKFWWDEDIEGMGLHELEEYVEALEKLLERVRFREMEVAKEPDQEQLPLEKIQERVRVNEMKVAKEPEEELPLEKLLDRVRGNEMEVAKESEEQLPLEKIQERVRVNEIDAAKEPEELLPLDSDSVGIPFQNMGLNLDAFRDQLDHFLKSSMENNGKEEGDEIVGETLDLDDLWCWNTS